MRSLEAASCSRSVELTTCGKHYIKIIWRAQHVVQSELVLRTVVMKGGLNQKEMSTLWERTGKTARR